MASRVRSKQTGDRAGYGCDTCIYTGNPVNDRGYVLQHDKDIACTREFKVRHGQEHAAEELNLIVDCGGRVKNISISTGFMAVSLQKWIFVPDRM